MLNIARVLVLPALLAANTIYMTGDGSESGLQLVVTGSSGDIVKSTKTSAEIQNLIDSAANSVSDALVAEAAAIRTELAAGDTATLAGANAYTDGREVAIRTDLVAGDAAALAAANLYTDGREEATISAYIAADTAVTNAAKNYTDTAAQTVRDEFAVADAAGLAAAKAYADAGLNANETASTAYTDAREVAIRAAQVAGDTATLATAEGYTDTREAAIRADMASGTGVGVTEAKAYTDAREAVIRTDFAAADAAGLAAAKTYTDGRETLIRSELGTDIVNAQSAAQAYSDTKLAAEKVAILNTTDTKIATAIGALDMTNSAVFAADIAARDALVLSKSSFVLVADATGDLTVGAGAAMYFYNLADATFTKVAEYESMHFMDLNQTLLAKLGEQDGLLTFNGQLVATVQHTGSEW